MREKLPFYVELADFIREKGTFDLTQNEGQYPTIHWIIARKMLEDFSEFDRHQLLTYRTSQVKACFENAIAHLQSMGTIVYRSRGRGKRNIKFISTNPNYEDCQELDFKRQTTNLQNRVLSFQSNLKKMHPEKRPLIESETRRFGNKLLSLDSE